MKFLPPPTVTGLKCLICRAVFPPGNVFTCPHCGEEGILDVEYDYRAAAKSLTPELLRLRPFDQWRYRELLPISPELHFPNLKVGGTPVYDIPRLAHALGIRKLFLKDEGGNPTSSFKDRASAVGVLKAMEFHFTSIACASTGNAASSLAGLSAAAGLRSYIFVPERAPEPKLAQLLIFGATVFKVRGSYEQAFELCREACARFQWYSRNSGTNPYLVEGKKTAGLEIAEQFRPGGGGEAERQLPSWVVVSVGDGCTIGGIGKGLREMRMLGFTDRMPRLLGVQAEGARPILDAFLSGKDLVPSVPATVADSIAVGTPRNWRRAIATIRASHGEMIAVADAEILEAMRLTARLGGVFGEPAAVAAVAGLKKALQMNIIKSSESAVVIITGNGLKDVQSARKAAGDEHEIEPTMESLVDALSAQERIGG
jgi:threonine synthase